MKLSDEAQRRIKTAWAAYDDARLAAERLYEHAARVVQQEQEAALPPGSVVEVREWSVDGTLRGVVTDRWAPEGYAPVQFLEHPLLGPDGLQDVFLRDGCGPRQPLVTDIPMEHLHPTGAKAPFWRSADLRDGRVVVVEPK